MLVLVVEVVAFVEVGLETIERADRLLTSVVETNTLLTVEEDFPWVMDWVHGVPAWVGQANPCMLDIVGCWPVIVSNLDVEISLSDKCRSFNPRSVNKA